MKEKLKKLIEERANLWENDLKPLVMKDEMDADDKATYASGEEKLDELDADIDTITAAIKREDEQEKAAERRAELLTAVETEPVTPEQVIDTDKRYAEVFDKYMRRGLRNLSGEEMELLETESRALTTGTGSSGGFTIPTQFQDQIVEAQSAFGGLRNAPVTTINTTDGADIEVPTSDDTGNVGELIGENVAASEQDVVFGQKVLSAWLWSSKLVRVPLTLIQDSAFDMESFLSSKFGERIGRAQATFLVSGTGASQPEGIVTNAATEAAQAAAALELADFVNLEHSVDPAYRAVGHYVLSDDALKATRLVVDLDGRPIWNPGVTALVDGPPNQINGYPYTIDIGFDTVATTNKPILFGDLSHYWVRDVIDFEFVRLDERYAEFRQAGFLAWARMDARPVDAGNDPWKVLEMA